MAAGVDPRIAVGAATLARDPLARELERSSELVAQRRRRFADVPRRSGWSPRQKERGRANAVEVLGRSGHHFEVVKARAAHPTRPPGGAGGGQLVWSGR